MASFVTNFFKLLLFLALITGVGQVPFRGQSLESRYHEYVNSEPFQRVFWVTVRPVTWTAEKVTELTRAQAGKLSSR